MYIFWLVIKDLFWFVVGKESVTMESVSKPHQSLPPKQMFVEIAAPLELPVIPETLTEESDLTYRDRSVTPESLPIAAPQSLLHAPVIMYVAEALGTPFQITPQQEFDSVTEIIPYGAAVTVVGYRGRYASVLRHHTGFVLKDHLQSAKTAVLPQFVAGVAYSATHPVTVMTRNIVHDEFGAGALALPLQAGEYVLERLLVDNRRITWGQERPRVPGTWQNLLKGTAGIHISITPKTDSIMEWNTESGEGRLAYVESVAPNVNIQVSLVGLAEAGVYETMEFTSEQWRELRPVFIEVA